MAGCLSCDTCVPWFCPNCREERCSWFEDPCRQCGATRAAWQALPLEEQWTLRGYTPEEQAQLLEIRARVAALRNRPAARAEDREEQSAAVLEQTGGRKPDREERKYETASSPD